jgi:uroporphyrinogen decarboxylase
MASMSKKERVKAALQGKEVDRPPVSFWRHFFEKETSAEGLAEAMLGFQKRFDWDFMKVNPRACYHVEDWGCRFRFSGDPHVAPVPRELAVHTVEDWKKITVLPPDKGALGEQLQALKLIKEGLQGEAIYFLETIFTPLSIAGRLVESEQVMKEHMQEHPEAVHAALEQITETYQRFARACLDVGASGLFFATTAWASYELLTDVEYAEFGRLYDLKVLEAVQDAEFNLLHVCRGHNMLHKLADYPVHAINWASRDPSNPSLQAGKAYSKAVVGGIDHRSTLKTGSVEAVVAQAKDAKEQTGGLHWILAGECSIPTRTPERNLQAIREAVETL